MKLLPFLGVIALLLCCATTSVHGQANHDWKLAASNPTTKISIQPVKAGNNLVILYKVENLDPRNTRMITYEVYANDLLIEEKTIQLPANTTYEAKLSEAQMGITKSHTLLRGTETKIEDILIEIL